MISELLVDVLVVLVVICCLIWGGVNYIKDRHFISLTEISKLKDISDKEICVVAVFDDTSCILCLNVFRKLQSKLKYPLFYLHIENAKNSIELEHFTPAIFIVCKGEVVSSIYANRQDKSSKVNTYLDYINNEFRVIENVRA